MAVPQIKILQKQLLMKPRLIFLKNLAITKGKTLQKNLALNRFSEKYEKLSENEAESTRFDNTWNKNRK